MRPMIYYRETVEAALAKNPPVPSPWKLYIVEGGCALLCGAVWLAAWIAF